MRSGPARHSGIQRQTCHERTYVRSSGAWDGKILRFLGPNWNAGSPAGRLPPASLPAPTEATPRPGPPSASPTRRPPKPHPDPTRAGATGAGGGGWPSPTPSCTAIPTASFLDGGSHPEELAEEAARLGLEALAVTDHDGMYGVVRFAEAARALSLPTIFGAELTLAPSAPGGRGGEDRDPRPGRGASGGAGAGAGGVRAAVPGHLGGADGGGQGGAPGRAGTAGRAARRALDGAHRVPEGGGAERPAPAGPGGRRAPSWTGWSQAFGRDNVHVELWDHGDPLDSARNDALVRLADRARVEVVATNNVHYATPARRRLATALAAVRARRSLDDLDGWLPAGAGAHLRSGLEQAARLARYPGTVELAAELGRDLRLRPGAGRAPPARLPGPAGPHRDDLAARAGRPGRDPALRPPAGRADPGRLRARSTTSWP